jgi:beta-lysine 5,6-aminomutase alpha subunit
MGKLNLDKETIQKARTYAKTIALDTQEFINQHTTVTVERSVCRLLGFDGVDQFDVPLPNIIVDQIVKNGDLGHKSNTKRTRRRYQT